MHGLQFYQLLAQKNDMIFHTLMCYFFYRIDM